MVLVGTKTHAELNSDFFTVLIQHPLAFDLIQYNFIFTEILHVLFNLFYFPEL